MKILSQHSPLESIREILEQDSLQQGRNSNKVPPKYFLDDTFPPIQKQKFPHCMRPQNQILLYVKELYNKLHLSVNVFNCLFLLTLMT
jgi:hypothetical protein